jgi:hydantoinase/carbamoylase family amidase
MNINLQKIQNLFAVLEKCGKTSTGGITRLSYSAEFQEAQVRLKAFMENIGMSVITDPLGNLIGTYPGRDASLPSVCCGSHLDSVINGGAFDGVLGIVSALECVRSWHQENWRPHRSLTVIAFIEEEGSSFGNVCLGSRGFTGELIENSPADFKDRNGKSLSYFLTGYGLSPIPNPFKTVPINKQYTSFIELHIEQGKVLENTGYSVGIVSAIAGIKRLSLLISGKANHAGSTTMQDRHDALVAAADLSVFIYKNALTAQGSYVATVGKFNVLPNEENVVPGEVSLSIEIRSEHTSILQNVRNLIIEYYKKICLEYNVEIEIITEYDVPAVPMDKKLMRIISQSADALKIKYKTLPSWSGHDSMIMSRHIPTAMIFVPSKNGISHSPLESSDWADVEKAVNILNLTLSSLADQ